MVADMVDIDIVDIEIDMVIGVVGIDIDTVDMVVGIDIVGMMDFENYIYL